jgi:hypothetical protein
MKRPAPIDQKAQPAAVGRSRKTAEAVNKGGAGYRSARLLVPAAVFSSQWVLPLAVALKLKPIA